MVSFMSLVSLRSFSNRHRIARRLAVFLATAMVSFGNPVAVADEAAAGAVDEKADKSAAETAEKPAEAASDFPLRVMAWNIRHGRGEDGKVDLERIAGVIAQQKPDVVLLQEVDERARRTGQVAQTEVLARLTGLKGTFGKAMDFEGGGYGNAVLARWEPVESRVIPLPGGDEPRCALAVAIDLPDGRGRITVVSTHLDARSAEARATHAKELSAGLAGQPECLVLGGDFNATRDDAPLTVFGEPWLHPMKEGDATGTIPAGEPRHEIDFILVKPARDGTPPAITRYMVVEEKIASDHRPIVMDLRLPATSRYKNGQK